ncbi:NADH dehydrogenase [ubiquinone] 1 subunit C2 [Stegastes partitus]|uniref:NADH dehydrogenase [ubiquinone] 1 subunit C2 n=1 Tax=Stegastes partitus TaxID=144197 RepID=A0A3B5ABN0_9TELE|nr:PREDICTED: NADH dehydrogenase [ubiquinone] 1 subunit C2 [Stegastes partitus]
MKFIPDEAKGLPPPEIVNRNSVGLGGMGWLTALLQNALKLRPALKSGLHRQVLYATVGWLFGYHVTKVENYTYAKLDRDMNEYVRRHPDDFVPKEKKTFAEIVEPFHPVR